MTMLMTFLSWLIILSKRNNCCSRLIIKTLEVGKINAKFSYHTHTDFSDGRNTPEEMLQQAADLGWEEIGISDHLIVHKNIRQSFSWPRWEKTDKIEIFMPISTRRRDGFYRHADHLRKLARGYNLKVRVGAEVDFFCYDGWAEEFDAFANRLVLDYCISGNHFLPLNNGEQILDAKDSGMLNQKISNRPCVCTLPPLRRQHVRGCLLLSPIWIICVKFRNGKIWRLRRKNGRNGGSCKIGDGD